MTRRKAVLAACSVIFGVSAAVATAGAWDPMHRQTALTFNRAVSLPGVMLEPGTYVFELANPESGSNVVRVRREDYRQVYFAGFTHMVVRQSWAVGRCCSARRSREKPCPFWRGTRMRIAWDVSSSIRGSRGPGARRGESRRANESPRLIASRRPRRMPPSRTGGC
jgi:hypothetical protein